MMTEVTLIMVVKVVDDNALHPEVQRYLGRGQPVLGLKVFPSTFHIFHFLEPLLKTFLNQFILTKLIIPIDEYFDHQVNFNRGFEAMFQELSQQITKNLVTSEYAKVRFSYNHCHKKGLLLSDACSVDSFMNKK